MKIIFCITNDISYDQRMHRIAETLSDAGHEIEIVGRILRDSKPITLKKYNQTRIQCLFTKGILFYAEFNLRLFIYLLKQRVDLIGAIDLDTIIPVYYASLLKGTKRSFDAHELFPEVPELVGRSIVKKTWQNIEQCFMKKFPLRYTVSDSIANYYLLKYKLSFEVIRNLPIKQEAAKSGKDSQNKYIFYQGALNDGRGLPEIIKAMSTVKNYQLKIAGEGDLSSELRALVADLRLSDRIEFLGKLPPSELRSYTEQASIGVNLLENKGLSYYYSLANKFFDYMHAAIPIVSMNFPEYKKNNDEFEVAVLLDELTSESILHAISYIECNYEKMTSACRLASSNYSWNLEGEKLLRLYEAYGNV